jgi:hypothetical protein
MSVSRSMDNGSNGTTFSGNNGGGLMGTVGVPASARAVAGDGDSVLGRGSSRQCDVRDLLLQAVFLNCTAAIQRDEATGKRGHTLLRS